MTNEPEQNRYRRDPEEIATARDDLVAQTERFREIRNPLTIGEEYKSNELRAQYDVFTVALNRYAGLVGDKGLFEDIGDLVGDICVSMSNCR